MKYFHNLKYIFFALSVAVFTSCDIDEFLNPVPDTAISADSYFQTDADVLSGIIGIYDALQGVNENTESNNSDFNRGVQFEYLLTEHRSDNTRSATLEGSRADFHRYVTDANSIQSEDYYQSMYEIIFRANSVINYVAAADASNIAKYTAEAKFLRAYAYFNLVRLYGSDDDTIGSVPLVTSVVASNEVELLFTRAPKSKVYEQIVEDLQEAVSTLDNSYKARASRGAAQGLLAKVYLSQPSPNASGAKSLCEAIIAEATFSLEGNFSDVFYNELNNEVMFVIRYDFGNENESQGFSSEFTSFNRQGRQDGLNIVNPNLIAAFVANGGNRTAVSYTAFGDDADLPVPQAAEVAKFLPDGSDVTTDSSLPTYGTLPRDAGNDWIVLRYADVLLMHVEATLGVSGATSTSDSNALSSFNAVRNRAGLANDADGSITQEELLLERRVELAFENQRFFDLLRFGVADTVLQNHSAEDNDEDISVYPSYNARKLLLPIPSREINLSKGLLNQNPGY
ncbi:RagB/SusD family nutrient uptake outer membrane protein [uncultured Polaribacter sp.]|uniref:RagB/SusD family nutrient uptake outer membrane protein n=1 Tax=uncultured Polaribacter sp. TaxID=174711 RepID=UPI00261D3205|nr:RagB/SusD family nutrient uptake outer membrane protein [uncultured Polaribacter sp.]